MRRNGITMLVIALLLLAAYGGPAMSSASPTTPEQPAAAPALAQGEAVTLQFLTISDADEQLVAFDQMTKAFQQSDPKYANVQIQFTAVPFSQLFPSIESAVAAGARMGFFLASRPGPQNYTFKNTHLPPPDLYTPP